ncbi:hypothetical protein PT282_02275 [Bifidobacterium sp. ESL0763]|uniref:hypothetical protein n=1 Tax=Bifidobacterium sp. ESL0763 TaxID=2983227 RepID=UPI0023F90A28|nr:hypothetical protein [Bifidobacterium sp. ESL0763]MDF7663502.1 hypothetical protein [Bifidobacterium sp. ESL0763]
MADAAGGIVAVAVAVAVVVVVVDVGVVLVIAGLFVLSVSLIAVAHVRVAYVAGRIRPAAWRPLRSWLVMGGPFPKRLVSRAPCVVCHISDERCAPRDASPSPTFTQGRGSEMMTHNGQLKKLWG